jgi:hypothetical protein
MILPLLSDDIAIQLRSLGIVHAQPDNALPQMAVTERGMLTWRNEKKEYNSDDNEGRMILPLRQRG